jgi:hypothetical protein
MSVNRRDPQASEAPAWHAGFVALLPAIEHYALRAFCSEEYDGREEAVQAVVTYAAVAYARLFELNKVELAKATPLAKYGVKQHRAGRVVGTSSNCRDVGSASCRLQGCRLEQFDEWKESLCQNHRSTPADIAALRIDFTEWARTLSSRDRQLAAALAVGETTSYVASMFRITAGRVSQLRQELYRSWLQFTGEVAIPC